MASASAGPPGFIAQAKAGKIKIIASGSPQRLAALPAVPTVAELGYPGFDSSQWFGLLAPAKTPAPVIARLHEAAAKALNQPAVQERLIADGSVAAPLNGPQFAAFIKSERERWGDVVRKARLKVD